MRMTRLLVSTIVLAAGCAASPADRVRSTLTESTWQLHSIQSMDDAQGKTLISDPTRFTLRLGTDGTATLRLECNRGTGSWTVRPAGDGKTGQLSFGPIAATRALCEPPHLDERVARDLAFVRGYRIEDDKLFLSLMADGGIYEWRLQRP